MKRSRQRAGLGALALLLALGSAPRVRAELPLAGLVLSDGDEPVGGALVTIGRPDLGRTLTVYTDPAGRFTFPAALPPGRYALRVRAHGFRPLPEREVASPPGQGLRLRLTHEPDGRVVASTLPANRWFALLLRRITTDARREELVRQCGACHQQGDAATRAPRSEAEWRKLVTLMTRMGAVLSPDLQRELPGALAGAWSEAGIAEALGHGELGAPPPLALPATRAVVTEWPVAPPGAVLQDVAVHADGSVWAVDAAHDQLLRLDPATGAWRAWPVPRGAAPLGGVLAGGGIVLPANGDAHVGPASLAIASDGGIWLALALGTQLARLDPASEQWTTVDQPEHLSPSLLRTDPRGRLWYTLARTDAVAMYDPATRARRLVRLPARGWGRALANRVLPPAVWGASRKPFETAPAHGSAGVPIPEGLDVAPDGGVWFSQPHDRRIGRIDPDRGDVRMIDTPFAGPRGLRFDSKGRLWIAGFSSGLIARFDPAIGRFETWRLPTDPPGSETPAAVAVDRRSDTVWIAGSNSDSIIRFEPDYARFTAFPLPARGTYMRALDLDARGAVWTGSASLPAWQTDGAPQLIRLEPEGVLGPNEGRLNAPPGD